MGREKRGIEGTIDLSNVSVMKNDPYLFTVGLKKKVLTASKL